MITFDGNKINIKYSVQWKVGYQYKRCPLENITSAKMELISGDESKILKFYHNSQITYRGGSRGAGAPPFKKFLYMLLLPYTT